MLLWPFNKYPGTDYETFNWEWLIGLGKKMEKALHDLFSDTGALHQMVDKVLGEHPEWTTTVMDGAISTAKLMDEAVTRPKLADNITDYIEPIRTHTARIDTYTGGRVSVYSARIPAAYKPTLAIANDVIDTVQNHSDNARDNHATVSINAGLFDVATGETRGFVIQDHIVVNDTAYINGATDAAYIYMKDDGELGSVPEAQTLSSIVANINPQWLVRGWYPIVENGIFVAGGHTTDPGGYPRSFIAQDFDGNYLVGCCGGYEDEESGMSMVDIYHYITDDLNFDVKFAYSLDGGASSSLIIDSCRVNRIESGTGERPCANYIQFVLDEDVKLKNSFLATDSVSKTIAWYGRYIYNYVSTKLQIDKSLPVTSDCNNVEAGFYTVKSGYTANIPSSLSTGLLIALKDVAYTTQQIILSSGWGIWRREIYKEDPDNPVITDWELVAISDKARSFTATDSVGNVSVNRIYQNGATLEVYWRSTLTADVADYGVLFKMPSNLPRPYITIPDKFYINGTINTGNGYLTNTGNYCTRTPLTAGQEITVHVSYTAVQ